MTEGLTPERRAAIKARQGTWPDCAARAFVDGAAWFEFSRSGATIWGADRDKAEAEATARYGPVTIEADLLAALEQEENTRRLIQAALDSTQAALEQVEQERDALKAELTALKSRPPVYTDEASIRMARAKGLV
jgi:hypothetical protein